MKRFLIAVLSACCFSFMSSHAVAAGATRPNVIFILMDDLGWRDTGFTGSTFYETPNIDRLARQGVMLTKAYAAAPICSPTRASCLTGMHPARVGITQPVCSSEVEVLEADVQTRVPTQAEMAETKSRTADPFILKGPLNPKALQVVSATRLKPAYTTIAELLRADGYRTGHFGKWHLGPPPYSALEQGFDLDVPHANTPGPLRPGHFGPWPDWPGADGEAFKGRHIDDVLADRAIDFIGDSAKVDQPFFMNFWPFGVHIPFQARQELIDHFRAKAGPQAGQRNPLYAAMIKHTDDALGRLWKAVEDAGLADRTVLVFLSDNGGVTNRMSGGGKKYGLEGVPVTDNAPLRGHKGDIYEGGVRVPGFIVWPGVTMPGATCDVPFSSVDAFATIAEICGVANVPHTDGRSFAPALRGQPFAEKPVFVHRPHYGHFGIPPGTSVVSEGWKLIRFQFDGPDQTDRHELYRLTDDPGETRDVAADRPEVVARLGRLIDDFVSDTGAVLPRKNPEYRPEAATPRSSQARPPNILFVVIDDLNDWVYHEPGHPQTLTPQIDRLMARGMRFLNAHVAAPVCNPSRVAMLTGLAPTSTGIYAIPQYMRDAPRLKDAPTLMQTLRAHGYTTWGAGKVFHHFSGENLWSDPESWDEYAPFPGSGSRTGPPAHGMVEPGTDEPAVLGEFDWGPCNSNKRDADSMVDIRNARWAAEKLSRPADRPFFLAVGIMKPHLPWYVPQEYFDRHDAAGLPLPPTTDDDLADVPHKGREIAMTAPGANPGGKGSRNFHREFTADAQRWREAMRGYLACMSLADDAVGIMLDALEQGPNAGCTIVVLVSDHGWHLGEKEHWQKYTLWEEATRVPLVIAAPGVTAAGTETRSPVSLLDLSPTLMDLAGITPPAGLDGQSLLPLLRDPQACRQRLVVTTHSRGSHAVRSKQYRYIRYADGTEELYDHATDPNEWTNLAARPEMTAVKATLAAALPQQEAADVPRSDIRAPRFRCDRPGATASNAAAP